MWASFAHSQSLFSVMDGECHDYFHALLALVYGFDPIEVDDGFGIHWIDSFTGIHDLVGIDLVHRDSIENFDLDSQFE